MLILFDVDGTLVDEAAAERAGALELHRRAASAMTFRNFLTAWSAATERHFDRYLRDETDFRGQRRARIREVINADLDDEAADATFDAYRRAYESAWSLFPDVAGCLDALAGQQLGVVTNGEGSQQRRKLAKTGAADRFDCIVVSGECGYVKPSTEIFLHACELLGVPPSDAVYVGDRYDVDAQAARRAGLMGVWLDRGGTRTAVHRGPVIGTLAELAGSLHRARPA